MAKYFIKNGSEYYTAREIYDDRGMLLLGKGQQVTAEIKNKLERLGKLNAEKLNDAVDIHSVVPAPNDMKRTVPAPNNMQRTVPAPNDMQRTVPAPNDMQSVVRTPVTKEFIERINIRDNRMLEKPNEVLINIIFKSKTEPWWIYVNALSNYIDWLYSHSIDVAMISLMMAVKLGYSDEELTNLGIGTLLHDVGKLLVPKSVMEKPGGLTDIEISLIQQHCELGMSSLKGFNLPKEYTDIVIQHHERLDGSGYPKGLKGEEICRNARIVMIADAVDSITSYRPYRQPQTMDFAIKKLRDQEEKYPQEFISLLEKILQ